VRKLPFVALRLAATLFTVGLVYLIFRLDAAYLAALGIATYTFLDLAAFPIYAYLKKLIRPAPAAPAPAVKKKKPAPALESQLEAFLSFDRKLDFIIYFDAPAESEHQVLMWMPALLALRMNYVIVLRQQTYLKLFKDLALPVIVIPSLSDLPKLLDTGAKLVFYVNNGMRNTHMVREIDLSHIQLLHGDSDKPASYNPISVMYDYLFVSGQLAIDRYAKNGVEVPAKKFKIVGRPQSDGVKTHDDNKAFLKKPTKTVLYTCTWAGFQDDTNFSSIEHAPQFIENLLQQGFRVVFRPHPNSYSDAKEAAIIDQIADRLKEESAKSGKFHCVAGNPAFGNALSSMTDCINTADILLSDISSVVSDWLYSGNPYIMIDTRSDKPAFLKANELAKSAYYTDTSMNGFTALLTEICEKDPMWDARAQMQEYALSKVAGEDPQEKFLAAVREIFATHDPATKTKG
jgi:hypothetical protein